MQIQWRIDGFGSPARPTASLATTWLMDGIANPNVTDPAVANELSWVVLGDGEPKWQSAAVTRCCRNDGMFIEFWDRVPLNEQQTMIGRYRASGNVLGTKTLSALPDRRRPERQDDSAERHPTGQPRTKGTRTAACTGAAMTTERALTWPATSTWGLIFTAGNRTSCSSSSPTRPN